jgi:membrane protein implicated in regulation of membrane protease activity
MSKFLPEGVFIAVAAAAVAYAVLDFIKAPAWGDVAGFVIFGAVGYYALRSLSKKFQ